MLKSEQLEWPYSNLSEKINFLCSIHHKVFSWVWVYNWSYRLTNQLFRNTWTFPVRFRRLRLRQTTILWTLDWWYVIKRRCSDIGIQVHQNYESLHWPRYISKRVQVKLFSRSINICMLRHQAAVNFVPECLVFWLTNLHSTGTLLTIMCGQMTTNFEHDTDALDRVAGTQIVS